MSNNSRLPQLNLNLGITESKGSSFYAGKGKKEDVVQLDTSFHQEEISIIVSDQISGSLTIEVENGTGIQEIELPTYKLTITDTLTKEIAVFNVLRDFLSYSSIIKQKSIVSFLGIKAFDKESYLYENITYEPNVDVQEEFTLSNKEINTNELIFNFKSGKDIVSLYSGDALKNFKNQESKYRFFIQDGFNGKSFIGDIKFREKFLKLRPKVKLTIVKREKQLVSAQLSDKGKLDKLIYI